jgi:hypothetical protein
MSTGITVIIIVIAIIVVAAAGGILYSTRRRRLQQRFGPEYDRTVEEKGSRTKAEAELAGRERRVRDLDIRPLDPAARAQYSHDWAAVQEQFVDGPQEAVGAGQRLVKTVMNERGYPTEGDDQMLADLSVEHGNVLDHYRAAYIISQRAADGMASTEDLRQAMIHYRALFEDLLGTGAGPAATTTTETTAGLPGDQAPPMAGNGSVAGTGRAVDAGPSVDAGRATDAGPAVDAGPSETDVPSRRRS